MNTHGNQKSVEQLLVLMEVEQLYLFKEISNRNIAGLLNVKKRDVDRLLYESLGIKLTQVIGMYRIQHATGLLKKGTPYMELWKYSGFSSHAEMEREFEGVVR
ncbi:MAG: hypothetical protein A2X18_02510 [Bacteroidetes bacterium GWF2_40_14]|nr:MAG: hypothetical protein A2X18_02510 [Bacteroidetes bacterium GWF2_40_14]